MSDIPKGSTRRFPNGVFSDSSLRLATEVNPFRGTKNAREHQCFQAFWCVLPFQILATLGTQHSEKHRLEKTPFVTPWTWSGATTEETEQMWKTTEQIRKKNGTNKENNRETKKNKERKVKKEAAPFRRSFFKRYITREFWGYNESPTQGTGSWEVQVWVSQFQPPSNF